MHLCIKVRGWHIVSMCMYVCMYVWKENGSQNINYYVHLPLREEKNIDKSTRFSELTTRRKNRSQTIQICINCLDTTQHIKKERIQPVALRLLWGVFLLALCLWFCDHKTTRPREPGRGIPHEAASPLYSLGAACMYVCIYMCGCVYVCAYMYGHGIFILATHPEGKWTTNPNPRSPSIPAQT